MRKRILIVAFFGLAALGGASAFYYWQKFLSPNIVVQGNKKDLFIKTGSAFQSVIDSLKADGFLKDEKNFRFVSSSLNYENSVKPGRYVLRDGMSNKEIVQLLRSGKQTPVNITFNNVRTKEDFASKISSQLEVTFDSVLFLLNDQTFVTSLGFTKDNILCMIIPNTYNVYWTTTASEFFQRMNKEYKSFWSEERSSLASGDGFSPIEISILASIVQQESNKNDEKDEIAGVYINRLKKGIKLQADPTLIFAAGDFTIRRVLNIHKEIDSPYNTYMHEGLPPGPICIPSIASLDAVLHYSHHDYIYFCAKDDFSGYHSFAETYDKHLLNANRFQAALNRRGIKS